MPTTPSGPTGQGAGAEAADPGGCAALLANLAQNSWNCEFFNEAADGLFLPELAAFDPNVAGEYAVSLLAFSGGVEIGGASIDVLVGGIGLPGLVRAPARRLSLGAGDIAEGGRSDPAALLRSGRLRFLNDDPPSVNPARAALPGAGNPG